MKAMFILCKAALLLYPAEFRAEFADEILAAFQDHYNAKPHKSKTSPNSIWRQFADIANLAAVGFGARIGMLLGKPGSSTLTTVRKQVTDSPETGVHRVIWRVFFSWQAADEAKWLTDMSLEGWHFLDYKPFWYWFRHIEKPIPLEYHFERRYFFWWQAREEEAFLDQKAQEGWDFFKFFAGWYYFRRPLAK